MDKKIFNANNPQLIEAYQSGKTVEYLNTFESPLVWKEVYPYTDSSDLPRLSNESFIFRIQPESSVSSYIPEYICDSLDDFLIKKKSFFDSYSIAHRHVPALQQVAWQFYKLGGQEALDETN